MTDPDDDRRHDVVRDQALRIADEAVARLEDRYRVNGRALNIPGPIVALRGRLEETRGRATAIDATLREEQPT